MSLKDKLQQDLKQAMLARDSARSDVIKGLKSAILYAEVATGKRDEGLSDDEIIKLFQKEAKKRSESAQLYIQGGSQERADKELTERTIIEEYLPAAISLEELSSITDQVLKETGLSGMQAMGQVISAVKAKVGPAADGGAIAKLVKERLLR
jgi:uncharacterized protein YqeY